MNNPRLSCVQGDITRQVVDAIVNAANSSLLGGGGVDGAIHRVGGPDILAECRLIVDKIGRLEPGKAVSTTAGRLSAKRVIHTVGPVWHGGSSGEKAILASAYRESLNLAQKEGLRTIAFPSISTGAYRYPLEKAAKVAIETTSAFIAASPDSFDEIRFVLFSEKDREVYEALLGKAGSL